MISPMKLPDDPPPIPELREIDKVWLSESEGQFAGQVLLILDSIPEGAAVFQSFKLRLREHHQRIADQRDAWIRTAAQARQDADFYRDLLDRVASTLGREAFTDDVGAVHDSPIRLKVPELVARIAEQERKAAQHDPLSDRNVERTELDIARIDARVLRVALDDERGKRIALEERLRVVQLITAHPRPVRRVEFGGPEESEDSEWWTTIEPGSPADPTPLEEPPPNDESPKSDGHDVESMLRRRIDSMTLTLQQIDMITVDFRSLSQARQEEALRNIRGIVVQELMRDGR